MAGGVLESIGNLAGEAAEAITSLSLSADSLELILSAGNVVDLRSLMKEHRKILREQTDILIRLNREILTKTNGGATWSRPGS